MLFSEIGLDDKRDKRRINQNEIMSLIITITRSYTNKVIGDAVIG